MTSHVVLISTAALLLLGDTPREAAIKKDQQAFQGAWQGVSGKSKGSKVPDDLIKQTEFVFAGDKLAVKTSGLPRDAAYRIDPTVDPKSIDISFSEGSGKEKTLYGIYEFDGDHLKLCLTRRGKADRPMEFHSEAGSETDLMELQRAKPGK